VVESTQLENGDWSHAFIWQNGVMTDRRAIQLSVSSER
jgi:hypothetical protein